MLFDAYVPTRAHDSVEVRVRAATDSPVTFRVPDADVEVALARPSVSYQGRHFYKHTFTSLVADRSLVLEASQPATGSRAVVRTSTLPSAPGRRKLSIGVMADLHLSPTRGRIEQYRPGTRRLLGLADELGRRYVRRLEALGADLIVLPGDLVDPCTPQTVSALAELLGQTSIPCYPIIGNHEPWSPRGSEVFFRGLGLPECGYYVVRQNGVLLIMLSTPSPGALHPGSTQARWLSEQLRRAGTEEDIVLFSHFSLLLHPCVAGARNDGYQVLESRQWLLGLLDTYPSVRLFAAGHKNVPSMLVHNGIVHLLSPQLIQCPCGFDLVHLYEGGMARTTFEIDEQHYCEVARAAYEDDWLLRYGAEEDRNFCLRYSR
jgi:hypothetical protein